MNLSQLRYIVEVEKTGSISKAAQNLFVGQPNLSKSIKELEDELGIIIFKRTPKGTQATRKGEELLNYSKKVLSQIDEIESIYSSSEDDGCVKLSLCVPRATYLSLAFTKFLNKLDKNDKLKVYFRETDAITSINEIVSGDAEIAVIRYHDIYEEYFYSHLKDKGLKSECLYKFKMAILMSNSHPLVKYEDIPYHLLSEYTEITHGDYDVKGISVSKVKKNSSIAPPSKCINIYDRGSQIDILQRVEGTFMWVSPIPIDFLNKHNLVVRPCSLAAENYKDMIIYREEHHLEKYEKLFIKSAKQEIGMIK